MMIESWAKGKETVQVVLTETKVLVVRALDGK